MPWQLEISVIDVGQGDSSLIIATNGAQSRSMLIDAGLAQYAGVVHDYVHARLNAHGIATGPDHILATHYDNDHVGGLLQILRSDNLAAVADCLAEAAIAADTAAQGRTRQQRIAAGGAAAAAAAWGGYDTRLFPFGKVAADAGKQAARGKYSSSDPDVVVATLGAEIGRDCAKAAKAKGEVNEKLIQSPQSVTTAAAAAGVGARTAGGRGPTGLRIVTALGGAVADSIATGGLYRASQVIDTGALYQPPEWADLIYGTVLLWRNYAAPAPGTTRRRLSLGPADLGREVLWHSGRVPVNAPAGAPAVFVVATQSNAWQGANTSRAFSSNQPKNDAAIGLVVRFENFFYYTGDDLPVVGEDLIGNAVRANGFPDPQGGTYARPQRVAAFKCGHHGAAGSTSGNFLGRLDARATIISCGSNQFGKSKDPHPTQDVIDRINAAVPRFYLTNCKYIRTHIPASNGEEQLQVLDNRSRVCGDNADDNLAFGRHRGNVRLFIGEGESTAPAGAGRRFHVEYFDHDDNPLNPLVLVGNRTETLLY